MKPRVNYAESGKGAFNAMLAFSGYVAKSGLEHSLLNLVYFRLSQINGCAYCLDMHSKDLRAEGETEQRLHMMAAWQDASVYSERERAALVWAEAVTKVATGHVSDEVYQEARKQFSDEELVDLTMSVIAINSFNRINIA